MADEIEVKIVGDEEIQRALERLQRLLGGTLRVEIGTNVRYAAIHQFGGKAGPKKKRVTIPARPYMPPLPSGNLNDTDAAEVVTILNDNLSRAFGGERLTGRDVMTDVGRYLKTSTQLRFRAQRGPDGAGWKPTHRGGQVLRLSGRLRNSIAYKVR